MKVLAVVNAWGLLVPECVPDADALGNGPSGHHPQTPGQVPKAQGIYLTAEGRAAARSATQNCTCPCPPPQAGGAESFSNFWSKDRSTLSREPRELSVRVHRLLQYVSY